MKKYENTYYLFISICVLAWIGPIPYYIWRLRKLIIPPQYTKTSLYLGFTLITLGLGIGLHLLNQIRVKQDANISIDTVKHRLGKTFTICILGFLGTFLTLLGM